MNNYLKVNKKAYDHCLSNKNSSSYKFITESEYAYLYCLEVKDRSEVRKLITNSWHAYRYRKCVKDRKEVRKFITNSHDLENYNQWKSSQ